MFVLGGVFLSGRFSLTDRDLLGCFKQPEKIVANFHVLLRDLKNAAGLLLLKTSQRPSRGNKPTKNPTNLS